MGHRALVAYEQPNGNYSAFYSHWGALNLRLRNNITELTPFGGDEDEPDVANMLMSALSDTGMEIEGRLTEANATTDVDTDPVVRNVSMHELIHEYLDFLHHEAFYVVDTEWNVGAFRTLGFRLTYELDHDAHDDRQLPGHHETVGNGALVAPRWYDDEPVGDQDTTGRFRQLKSVVADMIEREVFTIPEAQEYMAQKVIDDIVPGYNTNEKKGNLYITDQYDTGRMMFGVTRIHPNDPIDVGLIGR